MPFCFILLYFLPFVKEAAPFVRKEHFSCYTKQGATGKAPRFRKSGAAGLRKPTLLVYGSLLTRKSGFSGMGNEFLLYMEN